MKKLLLLLIIPFLIFSQEKNNKKKTWEDFFVSACNESFTNHANMNHFKNDNAQPVCECIAKKIPKAFNTQELEKIENEAMSMFETPEEQAFHMLQNPKIQSLVSQCLEFAEIDEHSYIEINPEKLVVFITQCKQNFWIGYSEDEIKAYSSVINLDGYCDCYVKKKLAEFSYSELMDLVYVKTNAKNYAKNLSKYTEITEECLNLFLLD